LSERFAEAPSAPDDPTPVEAMAHRLNTLEGRKLGLGQFPRRRAVLPG
jgi:hypothetical protein